MNPLELVGLSYRYELSNFDLASWVWALTAFWSPSFSWGSAGVCCGIGAGASYAAGWGRLFLLFGLLVAGAVLARCGADYTLASLRRPTSSRLATVLNGNAQLNREAFRAAWEKLEPRGGQKDLTDPAAGGNEIRLNNVDEAKIVAEAAAQAVKRPLQGQGAFAVGLPVTLRDPAAVAEEVVTAMPAPAYPVLITPNNEWSRAAVGRQVGSAIEFATKVLAPSVAELKSALTTLLWVVAAVQVLLIALLALADIREQPQISTARTL